MESKEKRQKIHDGAENNLPDADQQLTPLFQQVLFYTKNFAAMPVDVQNKLAALDARQVAEFAKLGEIGGEYGGVTGFWLACVLETYGKPALLAKILVFPEAVFQSLDFNAAPQHAENKNKGISVLWQAAYLAVQGKSGLLDKLLTLPDTEFQKLDFNAAPHYVDQRLKGISVLWLAFNLAVKGQPALLGKIMALPDAEFQRLDFNAAPLHDDCKSKGISVFWRVCELAVEGNSAIVDRLLVLPDAEFQRLDFNAMPQHASNKDKGVSVLWLTCLIAAEGQFALLGKIMALPDADFQRLDFNVVPQHVENNYKGVSVLWQAVALVFKGQPALLDKMMALPDAEFHGLDFNVAPQHADQKHKGETVLLQACELAIDGNCVLLDKILELPAAEFQKLDFNAATQQADQSPLGISVLWQACDLALRGNPGLLDKILSLSDTDFQRLDFNAAPQHIDHPGRGVGVMIMALQLFQQNGHERLLIRICEMVGGFVCSRFEDNIPDAAKEIKGYAPFKTLIGITRDKKYVDWERIGLLMALCEEAKFSYAVRSAFLYRAYRKLLQRVENMPTIKLVLEQLPFESRYFTEVCQDLAMLHWSLPSESDEVQKQERKLKMALKYSLLARLSSAEKRAEDLDCDMIALCAQDYFRLSTSGNQDIDEDKINQLTTQWLEHVAMAEEQSPMTKDQALTAVEKLLEQLQCMRAELGDEVVAQAGAYANQL